MGVAQKQATPLPARLAGLVREAKWLVVVALALYLALVFSTYDRADPGWSHSATDAVVRNAGGLSFCASRDLPFVADFSLNASNELTTEYLLSRGATRVAASYDLSADQLLDLLNAVPPGLVEVVIHQRIPMFLMEHCVFCAFLSPGTDKTNCGRPCDRHEVELLDRVGMRSQADRSCAVLAYGDLKRVELAMALANEPRLLLMDEPTAGMAPDERGTLMALAAGLARHERIAVLFTEHDMSVVFGFASRVIVMHVGEIIAEGSPEEVRGDPRVREVYLGDA